MARSIAGRCLVAVLVVVGMAAACDACLACPNCKDALAGGSGETMNVARGYALSILIMLGMPFTLAGCFGLYVWREMRRLKRQEAEGLQGSAVQASAVQAPRSQPSSALTSPMQLSPMQPSP